MEFSRQEYWSGLPFPLPGDLPDPGIRPMSHLSPALAGSFFTTRAPWEVPETGGDCGKLDKTSPGPRALQVMTEQGQRAHAVT